MTISAGSRLGAYEIVSALGAGGMGEVYRARDTKLNRDVALKVLPHAFARDPDRLARFKREAQVLASLNHPHIGAIYGFEDTGETQALVLELVEGDTLADRIARGLIPLHEALPIARQICEALEAAHEHGIIHRDLKPANIKITPDGVVKVLDFGLAKLAHPDATSVYTDVTAAPTITSPAMMTGVGVLLGTAAYMSPEQAKGREADKRSDIWAFGCVLYEMLTGRRAFDGDDMTDVLGAVVRLEPNWEALPADVPQAVRTLLRRCLVKERGKRIADIAASLFALDHQPDGAGTSTVAAAPVPLRPLWRRIAAPTAGTLAVAAAAATLTWFATRPASPRVVRTMIATVGPVLTLGDRDLAITPDGSSVVYRGNNQLLVRSLDTFEPLVLNGLGTPHGVFTSPEGLWVGFFDGVSQIKKVAITGGSAVMIASLDGGGPRGATWGPEGTIVYATNAPATGLQVVSVGGGESSVLTKPDRDHGEGDHLWPEFLPGGDAVLYTITPLAGGIENAQVAVLDLRTGTSKVLFRGGSDAHYLPTGHLVYAVPGTLLAVAFDLRRREIVGTPVPVLEGVVTTPYGGAEFAVAANGSLVYVPGGAGGGEGTVVTVDRQGGVSALPGLEPDAYREVRVSPDGSKLALATVSSDDIWIYDRTRASLSRLTTDPARDGSPLWTPDGQRIVFNSQRAGYSELFWRPADGTGSDEKLLKRSNDLINLRANGWSPDGKQLLFTETLASNRSVIGQMAIERRDVTMLVKSDFSSDRAAVSPDGAWMAYESNVSGRYEIYIERYPELGNRQLISTVGGRLPLWSGDGQQLFFSSPDSRQMFAVSVQSRTPLVVGRPQLLFELPMLPIQGSQRPYDLAPDGRFVIIRSGHDEAGISTPPNLILVQNWFEEVKRLVPVN